MKSAINHPILLTLKTLTAVIILSVCAFASPQVILDDTGWSDNVGTWDPETMTGTLTTDIIDQSIEIASDNVTLDGNGHSLTTTGMTDGVIVQYRTGVTIKDLIISGFNNGIKLQTCSGITIEGIAVSGGYSCAFLDTCTDCTVEANNFSSLTYGISMQNSSSYNTFSRNTISGNNYGIGLFSNCNFNTVKYNLFSFNNYHIYIYGSSSNEFYNNNFSDHIFDATLIPTGSGNVFSLPDPIFGNYWDFYSAPDIDGDGIYDDPYAFTRGTDYFPFVDAFGWNHAPNVDAGPDQTITEIGAVVQLDGSQTWDPEGDSLTYLWTIDQKPDGSLAELSNPAAIDPTFVADVYGDYVITLTAVDFFGESGEDTVVASFDNVPPVAVAGENQSVFVGDLVFLDGSGSYDSDLDPLTYQWTLDVRPDGSTAELTNPTSIVASFTPDVSGFYEVSLVVNDGFVDSLPDTVSIEAVLSYPEQAVANLMAAVDEVNLLDPAVFKNDNLQNILTKKILVMIDKIDNELYQDAYDRLTYDILQKVDGWNEKGEIDKNDWILDPIEQDKVYPFIKETIELLENLI